MMDPAAENRRRLTFAAMALASILIAGGVIGTSAAPRAKYQLKQWVLEHPDPNCGAGAALFDELSGWSKVRTGAGLARALMGGNCAGILGEFAIGPDAGTQGAGTQGTGTRGAGTQGAARQSDEKRVKQAGDTHAGDTQASQTQAGQTQTDERGGATGSRPGPTLVPRVRDAPRAIPRLEPSRTLVKDPTRVLTDTLPATYSQARELVASLDYGDLGRAETVHPRIGLRTRQLMLPPAIAESTLVLDVLGQRLPMLSGDRLPPGVLAIHVTPPENNVGALGPFVWTRAADEAKRIFGTIMQADYHALDYPRYLLAEVFLNDFNRDGGTPFRPTDRVGDYVGSELERGWVEHGTIYLCVDPEGAWRLRAYPDFPAEGDCVHLVWNFNPPTETPTPVTPSRPRTETEANASVPPTPVPARRSIVPPDWLVQEQTAHQIVSVESARYGGALPTNIGPSILFRTDLRDPDGQSDLIVFAPFLYLDNPELLRDMILSAPLPDGSLPDEDRLLVASGDLHYISNGNLRPLLDYRFGASHIQRPADHTRATDIDLWANHVGFYLGMEGLPDADVSQR